MSRHFLRECPRERKCDTSPLEVVVAGLHFSADADNDPIENPEVDPRWVDEPGLFVPLKKSADERANCSMTP